MLQIQENEDIKDSNDEEEVKNDFSDCDAYTLFNVLQLSWTKLFIDIRRKLEFEKQKITQFVNIPYDTLDDDDCDEKLIEMFVSAKKSKSQQSFFGDDMIDGIYAISNKQIADNKKDIKFYNYFKQIICDTFDNDIPIIILNIDVDNFSKQFPFLCYNDDKQKHDILKYPNHILNDELFLGNMTNATTKQVLMDLKISHIVNMTPNSMSQLFDVDQDLNIKYLQCPIYDSEKVQILKYFDQGIDFIFKALDENKPNNIKNSVLIHCQAGVSRSATLTIAYLMKIKKMSFDDAYKYTLQRREIIEPNQGFVEQLKLYEKNGFVVKDIKHDNGILGVVGYYN